MTVFWGFDEKLRGNPDEALLSCLTFLDSSGPCGGVVWAALCRVGIVWVCELGASLGLHGGLHRLAVRALSPLTPPPHCR